MCLMEQRFSSTGMDGVVACCGASDSNMFRDFHYLIYLASLSLIRSSRKESNFK
jgi:hypothetical protein